MSTFQITSIVVALYEPERIPADFVGDKGYNVYHATLPLHHTDIPICVAHRTLKRKCASGTLARIRGSATIVDRTLLITASQLIPAAIQAVPTSLPRRFYCLPRVFIAGVVSSEVKVLTPNVECLTFDVTVVRSDVWPGAPVTISCWIHRDQKRFSLLEQLVTDGAVLISGVACGWTWDGKIMVDVHNIFHNNEGPAPQYRATDPPSPFFRSLFADCFPVFPIRAPSDRVMRSVLSMDARPSLPSASPPGAIPESSDPRRTSLSGVDTGPLDDTESVTGAASVDSTDEAADVIEGDGPDRADLPSVHEVRQMDRAMAVRRLRARVTRARRSSRMSSPDVPLREQVKIKISTKQLATLA